jgi:phycocyanobilin:ferredoxin oxidoreductase
MDPFFATNSPNPKRGDFEYPRLQIENRTYKSRVFRKIHLELAVRQDGLQVFHFVMYPRFYYGLPILCMDIVSYNTGSMFAIADTSPVRLNNTLPEFYATGIKLLMKDFATPQSNQALPSWGRNILSHLCISIKPNNDAEVDMFINYACALARIHLEVSRLVDPVSPDRTKKVQEIIVCHRRFCHNQTKNKKTFSILASSFGEDKAAKYIKNFMFECQA